MVAEVNGVVEGGRIEVAAVVVMGDEVVAVSGVAVADRKRVAGENWAGEVVGIGHSRQAREAMVKAVAAMKVVGVTEMEEEKAGEVMETAEAGMAAVEMVEVVMETE